MDKYVNDQADDLRKKREAILKAKELLEPFGDYFIVVEGASASSYSHEGIIKDLRQMLIQYEKEHGEDPDHDWTKSEEFK